MNRTILISALAGMLLFAGCGRAINTVEPARPRAAYDIVPDKRIVLDRRLARQLEVQFVNQSHTGNLQQVQTTVLNTTRRAIQFQYRFDWIDENGMLIDSPASTWIIRTAEPGQLVSLTSTAPSPRAADFRFSVKNYHLSL